MTITPFRLYEMYTAMYAAFTRNYDVVKYNFKTRVKEETLYKNKGKYFFDKHSSKLKDETAAIIFLLTNFINGKTWIGSFEYAGKIALDSYKVSMDYKFSEDIKKYWCVDGIVGIETILLDMMERQDFSNIIYFILLNQAFKGKLVEKFKETYNDNPLFDEFLKKYLTIERILIQCWNIDDNVRHNLFNIIKSLNKNN